MSYQAAILRDLRAGRATPSALAERIPIPAAAIEIILKRLETQGSVTHSYLAGTIPVYSLLPQPATPPTSPDPLRSQISDLKSQISNPPAMTPVTPDSRIALVTSLIKSAAAHTGIPAARIHTYHSLDHRDRPIGHARSAVHIVLRDDHGWGVAEIARAFACTASSVRAGIMRGRTSAHTSPDFGALIARLRTPAEN